MNPPLLRRSALLLCVLALVAEPSFAEEKKSPAPAAPRGKEKSSSVSPGATLPATPPGQLAKNKANDARARAQKAKKSGQPLVATRLEKTAAAWEKVARHQESAAKLEEDAARIERKTLEIKSQARRAHSLVEQTETRRARAVARLRELGLSEVPLATEPSAASSSNDLKPADAAKAGAK